MERTEKYHPSLFEEAAEFIEEDERAAVVPQSTLYDIAIQTQHTPSRRHVTIFGFSQQNREFINKEIQRCTKNYRKEEGKNWINVWTDDGSALDEIVKLNHKTINGEIIGVYRKSFGVVEDTNIYIKKKGVFKKVYEYFFGE